MTQRADEIRAEFEREFDMTASVDTRFFEWIASGVHTRAAYAERIRLAVMALRSALGPGGVSFVGFGAGGDVFEHEHHPATVFKIKRADNNRHFVNLDLETVPTEQFSTLLNRDKLLVVPTLGSIVQVDEGARLILRQAKGIPMDHVAKYVEAVGSARCPDVLPALAQCYVDFQPLLFSVGRINTDVNLTNHLIAADGSFLLHDLDIVYPLGGIDWHDTELTSSRSVHNVVEFLFWFLASNLIDYPAFAAPFRAALTRSEHLTEVAALAEDAGWPHVQDSLQRYGAARFLGADRFQEECRAVEATMKFRCPGALDRLVASLTSLEGDPALSLEPGIKLSPDEFAQILELTQAEDFGDVVRVSHVGSV